MPLATINLQNLRFSMFIFMSMTLLTVADLNNVFSQDNTPSAPLPNNGAAVDEVVVESSLYIKPKPKPSLRRTIRSLDNTKPFMENSLLTSLIEHKRVKRYPEPVPQHFRQPITQQQPYGQSQAAANAAANNQYFDRFGFGSSAANAQSQAFNAYGPAGSFGASSAGTITQALNANRFGTQNSAGASMSQVYHLPNGQTINFASTNTFGNAPGSNANSRGSAVTVSEG